MKDKPAFPTHPPKSNGLSGEEYQLNYGNSGATIRQYYKAKASVGLVGVIFGRQTLDEVSNSPDKTKVESVKVLAEGVASLSGYIADAMMEEDERHEKK